jgi:hypothetical protein
MHFKVFAVTAFGLAASVHAAADLTPDVVVKSIEEITKISGDTNDLLKGQGSIFTTIPVRPLPIFL